MDLVGEKLARTFVEGVLSERQGGTVCTLVPLANPFRYVLLTDAPGWSAQALEAKLAEAHHYGLARNIGQLAPVSVCCRGDAAELLLAFHERHGTARGGAKPTALLTRVADAPLAAALSEAS